MIRLAALTDEELKTIGRRIGEAFYEEGGTMYTMERNFKDE